MKRNYKLFLNETRTQMCVRQTKMFTQFFTGDDHKTSETTKKEKG